MVKVGVSLGVTLCTDPENRNFARFGCDISEIDVSGDVEAQANEAVQAIITVTDVANGGLEENIAMTLGELPEGKNMRDELAVLSSDMQKLKTSFLPNLVKGLRRVQAQVNGEAPPEEENADVAGA